MHPCTHVRMQHAAVARAAPVLLPRCPGSSKCQHRHGIARAANTSAQTAVEQRTAADQVQEQQQQVPVHIARRLAALQEEVQQAYEVGDVVEQLTKTDIASHISSSLKACMLVREAVRASSASWPLLTSSARSCWHSTMPSVERNTPSASQLTLLA